MSLPLSYLELGATEEDSDTRIQAVRIACDGEVQQLDVPKVQSTTISAFDTAFRDDDSISDISRFLGLAITARRIPLDNQFRIDLNNDEAALLFRHCNIGLLDYDRATFGAVDEMWVSDTGPVVVARLDQKPLHPLHAAAIIAYSRRVMYPLFQECMDAEKAWQRQYGAKEMIFERRREVLAEATPAKFADFFEKYKIERVEGPPHPIKPSLQSRFTSRMEVPLVTPDEIEPRPEWADAPSPYDM